jgi:hypothetical protein
MFAKFPDGTTDFLGRYLKISTPLEIEDYLPANACVSQWALFVPPSTIGSQDALYGGLVAISDSIKSFKKNPSQATIFDGIDAVPTFDTWLGRNIDDPKSYGLVTLSHHTQDRMCFDDELCPGVSVLAGDIKRGLTRPSIAILAGCGTARPGATGFIRKLNEHGVSAVIATSTTVLAPMAGKFLSILIRRLNENASNTNYTID